MAFRRLKSLVLLLCLPSVDGCRTVKFLKGEGLALKKHVIKTVTAIQPISCGWQCVDTPLCFSMNVRKLPTGSVTCELNNSSKTANPQDLISSLGSQYYQMAEVEHCTAEQCIFKDALPDDWYRVGSKLLKLFHERKTWGQARRFCQSIGGDLVSINQENENEFIFHLIGQIKTNLAGKNVLTHWVLDGSDADISLFNGARYEEVDGKKALYLDGSYAYATTPAVDFTKSSFTMASYVKLRELRHPSTIYGYWKGPPLFRFSAYLKGKLHFEVMDDGKPLFTFTGGIPTINTWFHAAAVLDKDEKKAYLYLNGKEVGSKAVSKDVNPLNYSFYDIGLKRDANHTMKGYLKDLMIVKEALTGDEIINITDLNNEPFEGVWIGLNDITTEGDFHWPDGSQVTYSQWKSNQPNNGHNYEDCVIMRADNGNWADESCGKRLPFLCEKKT